MDNILLKREFLCSVIYLVCKQKKKYKISINNTCKTRGEMIYLMCVVIIVGTVCA